MGLRSSLPANFENPRILDAVIKHLCMRLYTVLNASQTLSKHTLTHEYSNNVVYCKQLCILLMFFINVVIIKETHFNFVLQQYFNERETYVHVDSNSA